MKRLFKISLLIMALLFFTACEKKEYKLVELTSGDLYKLLSESEESFVFATVNVRNNDEANKYLKDLRNYAEEGKTTIYYLDSSDLIFLDDEALYAITNNDLTKHYLYLVKNGNITMSTIYEGEKTLESNLSSIHYDEIELPVKDSEKKEYFKKAKEAYEEGYICTSYQYLQRAWTLESVKKYYRDHNYYKLINYWRAYVHLDDKNALSKEIVIFSSSDYINSFYYKGPKSKYKYPKSNDYDIKDFYVKDNIIYTSELGKEKFKKQYEILEISDDFLKVKEKDTIYNLYPFSYEGIEEE